ncbi:MAG: glycoside hydrolase family 57 protein [Verrucomicrobiae bacterium]|nr:glycoside hydrolase family 57 protein [Verrucomicrobiae bacterium]
MSAIMPLHVAFYWHMHQPDYVDPARRVALLPWVRLHAAKSYYDMIRLAEEHPQTPVTFNLTPVLVRQLLQLQRGEIRDAWLDLARTPANALTAEMQQALLRDFFSAQLDNMVRPFDRYAELLAMRGSDLRPAALEEAARRFTVADWRDLQVWFNLAWCGYFALRDLPTLAALRRKGRGFSEEEKAVVLDAHMELIRRGLAKYRELYLAGRTELTASPFYHPILPLLYNTDFTRRCMPNSPLPATFSFPEDVREHLYGAVRFHEEVFGKRPTGLWPSEGSVCPEIIPLVHAAGFEWMATDEEILFRTLEMMRGGAVAADRNVLFKGYRATFGGSSVGICFRDHGLSDFIGFNASKLAARDAARHLIHALESIASRVRDNDGLALILLDGENAWQEFADGGEAFLRAIYQAVGTDKRFRPVMLTNYFREHPPKTELTTLHTGSWIYANFDLWIGDPEENRAWDMLRNARLAFAEARSQLSEAARKAAMESLMAAEGSDWFWWYGPEFQIEQKPMFDELFRRHVRRVYEAMGKTAPGEVEKPILAGPPKRAYRVPRQLIKPQIDGRRTSYYEWHGAGSYRPNAGEHAMATSESVVGEILFGFDLRSLFLCVQWAGKSNEIGANAVRILFTEPLRGECRIDGLTRREQGMVWSLVGEWPSVELAARQEVKVAQDRVLELGFPLALFGQEGYRQIRFSVVVERNDGTAEDHPSEGEIELEVPQELGVGEDWLV